MNSSRAAFILVALLVTVPHPLASLWGGATRGTLAPALAIGLIWAVLSFFMGRRAHATRAELYPGLALGLDVIGLTVLLWTSGAAQNPFTLLYFVPITLSTVVAQKWTFQIAGLAVLGFAFLVFQTAMALEGHRHHAHHAHFFQHVQGMALALAVAGGFVTLFVHRIARALATQQSRIVQLSREKQRDQFAVALGALSAGAAHELGSPLGSVQLLAQELPHLEGEERTQAVETIVAEVQRMKSIIHSMDSSQLSAELLGDGSRWDLQRLSSLTEPTGARADLVSGVQTTQPERIIRQILRELLRNAHQVADAAGVTLSAAVDGDEMVLAVRDDGPGLTAQEVERALEPFVSYSGGTGLGLFLASVHARQLGGALRMRSEKGKGTEVALVLPLHPPVSLSPEGDS